MYECVPWIIWSCHYDVIIILCSVYIIGTIDELIDELHSESWGSFDEPVYSNEPCSKAQNCDAILSHLSKGWITRQEFRVGLHVSTIFLNLADVEGDIFTQSSSESFGTSWSIQCPLPEGRITLRSLLRWCSLGRQVDSWKSCIGIHQTWYLDSSLLSVLTLRVLVCKSNPDRAIAGRSVKSSALMLPDAW